METHARRARRWTRAEQRKAIDGWRASGLSCSEYAAQLGTRADNLWRWRRELASALPAKRSTAFVPLIVRDGASESSAKTSDTSTAVAEIVCRNGRVVRVFSVSKPLVLAAVVAAAEEVKSC